MLANIRQGRKCLTVNCAQAYIAALVITTIESVVACTNILKGRLLALFENNRLGMKFLAIANALAYTTAILITTLTKLNTGRLLALRKIIRQGLKCLAVTNALAYVTVVMIATHKIEAQIGPDFHG